MLDGRLIVRFERPGRQAYLLGENWAQKIEVAEILAEKRHGAEFPGFRRAMLTKKALDIVVKQRIESWRSALASVAGVYVIADRQNGKLYVGSATGEGGIWDRWKAYAETGHGDNKELKDLLNIPEEVELSITITVGRPVGGHGPLRRFPVQELVFDDGWGQPALWVEDPPGARLSRSRMSVAKDETLK